MSLDTVQADLALLKSGQSATRTAAGVLVSGLAARRRSNFCGLAIVSCDNVPGNGHCIRTGVMTLARLVDEGLLAWIEREVTFPSSMVDRITPAPTPESLNSLKEAHGVEDPCAIVCESFLLWVIEDRFPHGRPPWDAVADSLGGQCLFVPDVEPYERMKLYVLNAAHQVLAYAGLLLGYRFVHEALEDTRIQHLLRIYMREAVKSVPPVEGIDVPAWSEKTIRRFQNAAVKDTLLRLSVDSVARIEAAVLPQFSEDVTPGMTACAAVVFAAWTLYWAGSEDEMGNDFSRSPDARGEPLAERAVALCSHPSPNGAKDLLASAFGEGAVFLAEPMSRALTDGIAVSIEKLS